MALKKLKEKTIALRKQGLSYSEILKMIPVAKSTLSDWLRSVGLSKSQKQKLTQKKLDAIHKGAEMKREIRERKTKIVKAKAISEVGPINNRDLWLLGTMLYWAEGAKEKKYDVSVGVKFSNSDPLMIKLFLKWLKENIKLRDNEIVFELYLHVNYLNVRHKVVRYWAEVTGYPVEKFDKVYYKRHNINPKRRKTGHNYHGQLIIKVRKSTNLNRKITGWIEGICKQCGVV